MKKIIELEGRKYEEVDIDGILDFNNYVKILMDGKLKFYKEVKEEFKSEVNGLSVYGESVDVLQIGELLFNVKDLKELLKEYDNYLNK